MLALERFLHGQPQDIVDGSILFAFSAWHLYPDLIVLAAEPKKIEFKDKIIPATAVGTVGVECRTHEQDGIHWSLALSHLQYYGDPVEVRSDQDRSRVNFSQLRVVYLGSLLGAWRISPRDFLLVAEWFKLLWTRMNPQENVESERFGEFGWLRQLVTAANQVLAVNDESHQQNLMLLKHGSIRAKGFFSDPKLIPTPFFGLLNNLTISTLEKQFDVDCGIAYLRAVAEKLGLDGNDTIICYAHGASYKHNPGSVDYFELSTTSPFGSNNRKRWICPNGEIPERRPRHAPGTYLIPSPKSSEDELKERIEQIHGQGETCSWCPTGPKFSSQQPHYDFHWSNPPAEYLQSGECELDSQSETHSSKRVKLDLSFRRLLGNWRLGLFTRDDEAPVTSESTHFKQKSTYEMAKMEKVSEAVQKFKNTAVVPQRLRDYVCSLVPLTSNHLDNSCYKAPGVTFISRGNTFSNDLVKFVYAMDVASQVYHHLPKATVSLKLITRPLCNSAWFQSVFKRIEPISHGESRWNTASPLLKPVKAWLPNRLETFGCITLFDSGTVDLRPDEFENSFALCSEDTIYVPAVVLSDPFIQVPEHEMRSIIGNISRPGISILVSPYEPKIRERSYSYNVAVHEEYDFKREDNFRATSLHLSFTDWTFPLATEDSRTIDHEAYIVEAVISVRDRGSWVADIDIFDVNFEDMIRFQSTTCEDPAHKQNHDFDYTSLDNWHELLDEPTTVGIFRAHGNWAARLAAVSILSRKDAGGHHFGIFGPGPFCLKCLEEQFEKPGWNMLEYESTLPSFCID